METDAEDGWDLMSIWVISKAYDLDVEKIRFEVNRLKDLKDHGYCECDEMMEARCQHCLEVMEEKMLSETGYARSVFDDFLRKCKR